MKYVIRLGFLVLIIFILFLSSCSKPINVYLQAGSYLNPDAQNQALPVEVKIYQLTDANSFMQATFRQLWRNDVAVLGNSMVDKKVVILDPKQTQKIILTQNKDCHYLAVVAIFRQPRGNSWRYIEKITSAVPGFALSRTINIKGNTVSMNND